MCVFACARLFDCSAFSSVLYSFAGLVFQDAVSAITWGHKNQKLFVATGNVLHTASILTTIPTLQQLCQSMVASSLSKRESSFELTLPTRFKFALADTFNPVIKVGRRPYLSLSLSYVGTCVLVVLQGCELSGGANGCLTLNYREERGCISPDW